MKGKGAILTGHHICMRFPMYFWNFTLFTSRLRTEEIVQGSYLDKLQWSCYVRPGNPTCNYFPQEGLKDIPFTEEIIVLTRRARESFRSSALAVLCRPRLMTRGSNAIELGFLFPVGNAGS